MTKRKTDGLLLVLTVIISVGTIAQAYRLAGDRKTAEEYFDRYLVERYDAQKATRIATLMSHCRPAAR